MLFYLHGFRSSPRSIKAQKLAARMTTLGRARDYECPQLPVSPAEAAQLIHHRALQVAPNELTLVGSSLGGYYATWLAELVGCRCVLLNPAIRPDRDLEPYLGTQTVYGSDETIIVKPEFLAELRDLVVPAITRPERYLLVAATGDEVIDSREMVAKYPGAAQRIIEGSDHGLSDFDAIIDDVLAFAGVTEAAPLAPRVAPLVFQKR